MNIGGGLSRLVLRLRKPDAEGERRCRVEPRVDRAQLLEAADHEPGRDEQDERQRHLRSHQELSRAMAASCRRLAATVLVQRWGDRRKTEDRDHAEHRCRDYGEPDREGHRDDVEPDFVEARQARGPEGHEQLNARPGQHKSERAADQRQQCALGEEVARDRATASAECATDRDLTLPRL